MIESRIADLEQRMGEVVTILTGLFDHVSYDAQRVSIAVGGRSIRIDGATGSITIEGRDPPHPWQDAGMIRRDPPTARPVTGCVA
jgi:hypothetical protein